MLVCEFSRAPYGTTSLWGNVFAFIAVNMPRVYAYEPHASVRLVPRDLPPVTLFSFLEIPILLSFLHSKLSNEVIFPQPGLVIFENDVYYFVKPFLVICHFKS
jgi:hypothetical protein